MTAPAILIRGGRLIDPSLELDLIGQILLVNGEVAWWGALPEEPRGLPKDVVFVDASRYVVCPGFVDLHCHLREPGYEYKETIATGSQAAVHGGFTTICCMPNTNPAIDTRATVEFVLRQSGEHAACRVLPIGAVTREQAGRELVEMEELAQSGVVAYSDDGHPIANAGLMRHALEYSRISGLPVINHCEDPALAAGGVMNEGPVAARLGLKGMPAAAEEAMVARDILLAAQTGGRVHFAHLSTAGSVALVREAKAKGVQVTAEVTPHHLTMTEEWVLGVRSGLGGSQREPYDTAAKVNPPLRQERDVRALIAGLKDGTIDCIATDHAPHSWPDKQCEFDTAAFGISTLEVALGMLMSLVHRNELDLMTMVQKLTIGPARILSMIRARYPDSVPSLLGTIGVGAPADIVIFDPNREWDVDPDQFVSLGKNTPLAGCRLKGKPLMTIVGGEVKYADPSITLER